MTVALIAATAALFLGAVSSSAAGRYRLAAAMAAAGTITAACAYLSARGGAS